MIDADLAEFIQEKLGHAPRDHSLFDHALTHASADGASYERLEFLGDRVLGMAIARWLYERFPKEPEGKLSRRFNALVARETCGEVGRELGLPALIRLGRQAREDGANWGDNVVGDVVEALIGALYIDGGYDVAERFVRGAWKEFVEEQHGAPKHPKSKLQELVAARGAKGPTYEVVGRTGAHHTPRFTVRVSAGALGEAEAEGSSKQEAETAAAAELLAMLGGQSQNRSA